MKKFKQVVYIVESEKGWGKKVDETLSFDTYKEARKYCVNYNVKHNMSDTIPDWYMYAMLATPIAGDEGLIRE